MINDHDKYIRSYIRCIIAGGQRESAVPSMFSDDDLLPIAPSLKGCSLATLDGCYHV